MSAQHVPAWKRLGLRLKFANETASNAASDLVSSGGEKKRKKEKGVTDVNGSDDLDHQLKKARIADGPVPKKPKGEMRDNVSRTPEAKFTFRKKSVTFTSDTKVEDGDTAQTIQFWVPDSPGSTPMKSSDENDTNETEASVKRPKREKKPRNQKDQAFLPTPRKSAAALGYLDQFHHQRSSWKFNKNHETWILKHALSTEHIPSTQNLALASYLQGLRSTGARQRLVDQSQEALRSDDDVPLDDNDELHQRLLQALDASHVDDNDEDATHLTWLKNLQRGKVILLSLNETTRPARPVRSNGEVLPRAKKNKSRTLRIEVESSSSSESESEDEDSDTSESMSTPVTDRENGAINELDDETSSSDSSSESSEISDASEEESDSSSDNV